MLNNRFELNEQSLPFVEEIGRHMPGGFFIYRAEQPEELLYANRACLAIFGCADPEEFISLTGYTFRGMVCPDDYRAVSASIIEQIEANEDKMDYVEYRIVRKDGAVRWVDDYGHYAETKRYGGVFYVFISDITEKREKLEKDKQVRDAVIRTLTEAYNTVWLINDVETESCSLYHTDMDEIHARAIRNALSHAKYTDTKMEYVATMVAREDQERMQEEISLPYILRQFQQRDRFSVSFIRALESGPRYYRIDFGKVSMPGGKTGVTMGFLDVDDEIRKEQAYRDELLEQSSMITAMASDYRSVYHVNLDENDAVCYRADPSDKDQHPVGVHFPFYERFSRYGELYVDEAYRKGFINFIDPENIRSALSKENIISYRYLAKRNGREYYEMFRMAGVRHAEDRDDNIVHAIGVGFTVIDAEMRETLAKNHALSEALAAAEQANRAKTVFLSNMSHEIRTPMNAIIGLDSLALRKETLDDETREYLEKIGGSARHLLGLINDILDMSRIESGRMILRREEFSFRNMLEQINTMVMSQCKEKGLTYECIMTGGVNDYYIGDDMKLKQVLINILSNAIKFTDAPGSVTLSVERTASFEDQSTLRFSIKDTGIGMEKSFIPKIFDAFSQEDSSRSNKYGSTGLGMAITKNIAELMNGTISVESEKGAGTEFTVIIPLKNSDHQGPVMSYIKPKDMHVLVVDDEEIAAEHARMVLDEVGINADICLGGTEALQMMEIAHTKHTPYNLVLLDWKMPEMDGVEVAAQIRKRYDRETTVIILTSFNWDEIMDEALHVGVDSFLAKPLFASNVIDEFERIARKNNMELYREKRRAELKGRHILLAEDVMINAEIMKEILKIREALVDHAENGRLALELFRSSAENYYDAVLMDVRMPEMDGLEATASIRALKRPDAGRIPIIAMTANAFDEDVQRSLQVGMNAHLSKPVEPEHLYQTLEELIWEADQAKK
ncbi:MAG: response regulator [Oscillospiraceae bacterium]|nr:response regulator [Oscillospiraceae bacterium]